MEASAKNSAFKTPISKKARAIVLAAAAVVLVVAVILLVFSGSREPIVGKWRAVAAISSGEVTPIMDNSFLKIQRNGEVQLYLDGVADERGIWEVFDTTSQSTPSYTITFSDGSSAVLLYETEDELLHMRMGSITINFKQ